MAKLYTYMFVSKGDRYSLLNTTLTNLEPIEFIRANEEVYSEVFGHSGRVVILNCIHVDPTPDELEYMDARTEKARKELDAN